MPQWFAHLRTPNDNPFIESAFSTVNRAQKYPGQFLDNSQAIDCFHRYFTGSNTEHYPSAIDYLTPDQAHLGQRQKIVGDRHLENLSQRRRRSEENHKQNPGITKSNTS